LVDPPFRVRTSKLLYAYDAVKHRQKVHAQLSRTHIELGHPEEGIRSLEKAMRLSPRDPNVGHWMANVRMAHLHLNRYPALTL
jgi:hypothetical protein